MMEVFAGFLEHTDHHIGRLLDFLEKIGPARQHAHHGRQRQRRQRRGRPARLGQREPVLQQRARDARGRPAGDRRARAARSTSTTTRGAGRGRATRRSAAGSARPTAAASPIRSSSTGRRASRRTGEIRDQYAHVIDMVPTVLDALGIDAADADPRRHAVTDRGRVVRARLRRRRSADSRHHTQYFEMFGHRVDLSRRLARGVPGARDRRSRRRAWASARWCITEEKLRELDAQGWELYHVDDDFSETKNVADAEPRQADRDDRALVRRGRQVQGAADRQPRRRAPRRGAAAARAGRATRYVYYPGTSAVSNKIAPRILNRPHSITATVRDRRTAPRACCVAQGGSSGGYSLYVKDHKLHYAYNYLGVQQLPRRDRRSTSPTGEHELRFEFEPTGKPDLAHGKGTPGTGAALHRRQARRPGATCRSPSRSTSASPTG